MEPKLYWVARSNNRKTGDMPQAFVGETEEACADTCKSVGCPLLPDYMGGPHMSRGKREKARKKIETLSDAVRAALDYDEHCYAWQGKSRQAMWSIRKAAKKHGDRYSLKTALANSVRSARMVRYTAIGDGGLVGPDTMADILESLGRHGLLLYGFTRAWLLEGSQHWKGWLMASCMNLDEADGAIDAGWRASVVLPQGFEGATFRTPKGRKGVVCPFIQGKRTNCNTCGLCVASKRGPVIGFPSHI
jgi:hypothetical protein